MKDNKSENEILEKDTEKVIKKYNSTKNKTKRTKRTKKCKVLSYIDYKNFIIISFDGVGIRINGITEYPGDEVTVEYSGTVGKSDFKLEMK